METVARRAVLALGAFALGGAPPRGRTVESVPTRALAAQIARDVEREGEPVLRLVTVQEQVAGAVERASARLDVTSAAGSYLERCPR